MRISQKLSDLIKKANSKGWKNTSIIGRGLEGGTRTSVCPSDILSFLLNVLYFWYSQSIYVMLKYLGFNMST